MSAPPSQEGLDVNPDWGTLLAPLLASLDATKPRIQCQLVFSLLVFLGLSIRDLLFFLFESSIPVVKQRVGIFMGNHPTLGFAPQRVYAAWHDRFPRSIPHLHSTIVKPCMDEIALQESNKIISDPRLKVRLGACMLEYIRRMLNPGVLPGIYQENAPYSWDYLSTFTTSPNEYRKKRSKKAKDGKLSVPVEADEWEETPEGSTDESTEFAGETGGFWKGMGFVRNPTFALVFVFSIMAFTRNTGTNVFPMILGLFLEIGGTGSRILSTLSNAGACVSITTIERLKKVLSEDAVAHAVALMQGPGIFYIIFDNINIFLRKSQQRLFNKNSMIHATNAAVISIPDADPAAEDLEAKQKRRGKRAAATGEDIIPTDEDEEKICSAFVGLVMTLILAYCPGSKEWENRDAILKAAEAFMALDRPFPVEKTDGRPLGLFDVNEGSKKGIMKMLKALQEISGLSESEWAARARIIVGDWLTSNNLRGACRDRMDDINSMERLDYVEELSALWHFALNATHMIMRLHFGDSVLDPGSLAKHKGLLNRTWDAEKPNYADAKALIRHSLISRILYEVMLKKDIKRWADLAKWKPTVKELTKFAQDFVAHFTEAIRTEQAKNINDDYYAHSQYFIRDALIFCAFEHAVAFANAGRVLRVLKYWAFSFRGAGLHNYARECMEILLQWKYELSPEMQAAKERAWFYNRFGLVGRNIASDLYLEQNNFWVKRVNIAKGSGVTIKYMIEKGSAPVEAFREVTHQFARTFGFADRARRHKEVDVGQDLRLLTETMLDAQLHILTANRPVYAPLKVNKKGVVASGPRVSAVVDSFDTGAQALQGGKFSEFIRSTAWDPAAGYPVGASELTPDPNDPLINGSVFDRVDTNPLSRDGFNDMDDGDAHNQRFPGLGALGGGLEYSDHI
ncbi:hypothetical protein B0H14DRAFT_3700502 [Mycena olivaceomarginata]|nr:hypothetical protein B0H14DRAFT_3700502 [Mycena olivaceomarginata]